MYNIIAVPTLESLEITLCLDNFISYLENVPNIIINNRYWPTHVYKPDKYLPIKLNDAQTHIKSLLSTPVNL